MTATLSQALKSVGRDLPKQAAAMMEMRGEFIWDQEPPARWIAMLRAASPKSDVHGFLYLAWEPGEKWVPGQRWVLYEMLHPKWVNWELMEEFEGPNPRIEGHYCSDKVPGQFQCLCPQKLERWRGGPCSVCFQTQSACTCAEYLPYSITATQWRLFRKTGYVPRYLFWIVQGKGGGNKAFLTEQEESWLAVEGKPTTLPYLGQLPYAPFDRRVVSHIERLNALKRFNDDMKAYRHAMGPGHEQHLVDLQKEFRQSVVSWFDSQMNEECDLFVQAAEAGEMDDLPKTDIDWDRVTEESIPKYIEEGQLVHPSRV